MTCLLTNCWQDSHYSKLKIVSYAIFVPASLIHFYSFFFFFLPILLSMRASISTDLYFFPQILIVISMFRFTYSFMITLYEFIIISPSWTEWLLIIKNCNKIRETKKGFSAFPDELRYRTFPDFKRRVIRFINLNFFLWKILAHIIVGSIKCQVK